MKKQTSNIVNIDKQPMTDLVPDWQNFTKEDFKAEIAERALLNTEEPKADCAHRFR